MKCMTLIGLCRYLARVAQQDVIYKNEGRWVRRVSDFTPDEQEAIHNRAKGMASILLMAHDTPLDEVVALLRVYMPETHIGFKMQAAIIETCLNIGVRIRLREDGAE